MKQGIGLPVFPGIAMGPVAVYREEAHTASQSSGNASQEKEKLNQALETARQQLSALFEKTASQLGEAQAAIVEVQLLLLEDQDLLEAISAAIEAGASAADAVRSAGETFAREFAAMEDEYMRARSADIRDVTRRVHGILSASQGFQPPAGDFLLVAEDLTPSQTLQLPRGRVLAFLIRQGSPSGHTAILARTLGLPSLVQADIPMETAQGCKLLAVDGFTGTWYADPDSRTLDLLKAKQAQAAAAKAELEVWRGRQTLTPSGKRIRLMANIGTPQDAADARGADAEGVGLLRSEFFYLGRDSLPTEEALFASYREIARIMENLPVVIRTLDMGSDKQAGYMGLDKEENPALGLRGLRLCLHREDIFRTQLRAIYRASVWGDLRILLPMVSSLWELQAAKALCAQVRGELEAESCPTRDIPIGIMVETPAAAICAGELAKEAAFFCVGTNDLIQYTLAVDRQNPALSRFRDPHHPAVLALLDHIARAARENRIRCGICGDLATDPRLQPQLIRMGYTELSMAPGQILASRKRICELQEK